MSDETENTGNNKAVGNEATSVSHIICSEILDISVADELRTQLADALEARQPIILDGSVVERADTAALQVLTAFFQDARINNITVQWSSASDALTRSVGLLGLADMLDLNTQAA